MISPDFTLTNSPPYIFNLVEYLTVFANDSKRVKVADIFDAEDTKTLSVELKTSCSNNKSDWIKLSEASTSEINLVYRAP
jgi:hypothetical protein